VAFEYLRIHGEIPDAVGGELFIDPTDIAQTKGLITVNLHGRALFQQTRADSDAGFGARRTVAEPGLVAHRRPRLPGDHTETGLCCSLNRAASLHADGYVQLGIRDLAQIGCAWVPRTRGLGRARGNARWPLSYTTQWVMSCNGRIARDCPTPNCHSKPRVSSATQPHRLGHNRQLGRAGLRFTKARPAPGFGLRPPPFAHPGQAL
jgi:hypothetical protein